MECGAKKRDGTPCKAPAMENGRCRIHGGKTPRGADSPHFKTGTYSAYASTAIREKVDAFAAADPLDLTGELALARALLAEFLSRYQDGMMKPDAIAISILSDLLDRVNKTVANISKIKNDTALTGAEVRYLQMRAVDVAFKYFPDDPEKQQQFIADLFGVKRPDNRVREPSVRLASGETGSE